LSLDPDTFSSRRLYVLETLKGVPRELLNPNELSPDGTTSMTRFYASNDGHLVAYKLAEKGSDWFSIHFLNVDSGETYPDRMAKTKFTSLLWSHDNTGIFYSVSSSVLNRVII
jgi:prolyl oligopeptidase